MVIKTKLDPKEAISIGSTMPFALINTYDSLTIGKTFVPDPDEMLEARFFDESGEIRIFRRDDELCACQITDEPGDNVIDESFCLKDLSTVTIRKYISFDDDGQAYIAYSRILNHSKGGRLSG